MEHVSIMANDGFCFQVKMNVARMCGIYNNFLDEVGIGLDDNEPFVIHNHDSSIVLKVFQWCIYHHDHPVILKSSSGEYYITPFSQFDSNFFRTECSTLLQMLQAAEYLDIPILMEQCSKAIARMIAGKHPDMIRYLMNEQ